MDVLVTYDIADTQGAGARRLRQAAQVCSTYGRRVQLSVFECRVSPERLARLVGELQDVIDAHVDSVMVYRFVGDITACRLRLGVGPPREVDEPWLL